MQQNRKVFGMFGMRRITAKIPACAILALLGGLLVPQQAEAQSTNNSSLVKGREFSKVRAELRQQGWNDDTSVGYYSEARVMYEAGYVEVELCSQGPSYCNFYYRRGKQCLRVITQGEYGQFNGRQYPIIYKWSNECREE
jgi:hypothetical protein